MYSAIAGLRTHMDKLNVIGNNVANVSTNAYKTQRSVFRDSLYTMYSRGSDGSATSAGKNPSQTGFGSRLTSIDMNMATSTYTPGRPMDCMLYGDGFFLVGDKNIEIDLSNPESAKALTLTRLGDFEFRADGYLADGKGNAVYGFLNVESDDLGKPQVSDQLQAIKLPEDENSPSGFLQIDGIEIDAKTGRITGTSKDTDQIITIGFIAVGNVTNPGGVEHKGDSYYSAGTGSGALTVSLLGGAATDLQVYGSSKMLSEYNVSSAGATEMITGGLEASNVDLATEISEMITTQRGYQANTRIVTITDSMLEELVNMKR
ncbi:MAG: flagellar hook-basal body complex protein [Firmicutes bacterium]|nr:flagellar hook-basal body complex protein [Bacillota bacterium]